jgi:RNA polymerase sigma-70 factor (sigma-E family)
MVAVRSPGGPAVVAARASDEAVLWDADDAVTALYSAHYRSLVRLAALMLRDSAVAEEVVQDAFVGMHGKWRRLRDTDKALAYLRQSVVNGARSALRRRVVADKHLAGQWMPGTVASAEHGAMSTFERDEILTALRGLPERQRETLVLRYYGDLSEADIADAMGISRGAVKSHASRGMAALRTTLERGPR